jgi:hypothetical protein
MFRTQNGTKTALNMAALAPQRGAFLRSNQPKSPQNTPFSLLPFALHWCCHFE